MFKLKITGLGLILSLITGFSATSRSYEIDVHFYATYAMARYAGINHEVASVIASSAQWPDETELLGSPMVPDAWVGTKMRRLFHFACYPMAPPESAQNVAKLLDDSALAEAALNKVGYVYEGAETLSNYIKNLSNNCETKAEHPMAYNLLLKGLKEGNLIRAATAIHTIEDSFSHAGTPSLAGHLPFGHHNDRSPTAPAKFERMIRAVMVAMVVIRDNLPEQYIDKNFRATNAVGVKKNYEMTSLELAVNYLAHPAIPKTYQYDFYKDPEFVKTALKYILKKGQNVTGEGDYWILPEFPVEEWLESQSDLMAMASQGQIAKCVLAGLDSKAAPPTFIDCVLTKAVERLIKLGKQNGLPIVDRYFALSFTEINSAIDPYIKGHTNAIHYLQARLKNLGKKRLDSGFIDPRIASDISEQRRQLQKALRMHLDQRNLKGAELLDKQKVEVGLPVNSDEIIHRIVSQFTMGYLAKPLNDEHWMEVEDEGKLRQLELSLRVHNIRLAIFEMFGDKVRFIENDKRWSYPLSRPLIQNWPLKQENVLPLEGETEIGAGVLTNIKYITYNYNQIDLWVESALRYSFPAVTNNLFPADKCTVVSQITDPVTNITLYPALDIRDRGDEIMAFLRVMWNPGNEHCAGMPKPPSWVSTGLKVAIGAVKAGRRGVITGAKSAWERESEIKRRMDLMAHDLITTNILPDTILKYFQTGSNVHDEGISYLERTQGFKKFSHWGQLTEGQKTAFEASLQSRKIKDDTPYIPLTSVEKEQQ